jgi:hypothetical protein
VRPGFEALLPQKGGQLSAMMDAVNNGLHHHLPAACFEIAEA